MKTKSFIAFAACVAASALTCSCSNDENAATNGQLTAFTGGIVTEAPMERVSIGASESSTIAPCFLTRTSMGRDAIGGEGTFFWEPNDEIYVEDDNGLLFKGQSNITETTPRTTFYVNGSYTTKGQYDVYYCGTNASAGKKKVVIAATQTQTAFNNTKHFGASGDCGVAKTEKNTDPGKSGYKFDLEHKASYLCFLPYIASKEQREKYKIQSIELTSNNNIAGTYDLSSTGLSGEGEVKTITLNAGANGLLLAENTEAKSINNSLYMVIAPGTHSVEAKYTVLDTKTNNVIVLTKKYGSRAYEPNKLYDFSVNLGTTDPEGGRKPKRDAPSLYSGHNYYMWDAAENYWSGHEWDSTDPWQPTYFLDNKNYPKSKAADPYRWYNEDGAYTEASVNPFFSKLPNANEMAWYVMEGNAHWDKSTPWKVFGLVYTGGIWLKKLSVIAKENGKTLSDLKKASPEGIDMRTNWKSYSYSDVVSGKPFDSEISNYFFLPALGYYYYSTNAFNTTVGGCLIGIGSKGNYWSSTNGDPVTGLNDAYTLFFEESWVSVNCSTRDIGQVAAPFE